MERLGSNSILSRLRRILEERGIDPATRQVADDGPQPGDRAWHHAHRVELAMDRWRNAAPVRYQDARADAPDVAAWADEVITDPKGARSLLLLGPVGTGKTHQALGVARLIAEAGLHRWGLVFTTAPDFYAELRTGTAEEREAGMRRALEAPLLILDDLGTAKGSEWVEEVTYRLINGRYNRQVPTVFTTNLPPHAPRGADGAPGGPDLATNLSERVTSRLAESTLRVVLKGGDRRRSPT